MKKWYSEYVKVFDTPFSSVDQSVVDGVRNRMSALQSDSPLITMAVIAHNEGDRLLSCLWSLSELKTKFPLEIIVVDNDSTDNTADVIKSCGAKYLKETRKGCGFARQCALDNAKGEYYFTLDADLMYPSIYVDSMMRKFSHKGIVAVNGTYRYFKLDGKFSASLWLYETARGFYYWAQHFKRPEIIARGSTFACRTADARKEGYRTDLKRGEDGTLALALKKYGKIGFNRSGKASAVTGYRAVDDHGGFISFFVSQCKRILHNWKGFFKSKSYYEDSEDNIIK